jgi:phosphatidylserine/phosphatidylglycerophosphate/cardiolipin synthase-like enzyme
MKSNAEANVALYDTGFAAQVRASIEADMARSEAITLEQWKQRGLGDRIKEGYFGLFNNLF